MAFSYIDPSKYTPAEFGKLTSEGWLTYDPGGFGEGAKPYWYTSVYDPASKGETETLLAKGAMGDTLGPWSPQSMDLGQTQHPLPNGIDYSYLTPAQKAVMLSNRVVDYVPSGTVTAGQDIRGTLERLSDYGLKGFGQTSDYSIVGDKSALDRYITEVIDPAIASGFGAGELYDQLKRQSSGLFFETVGGGFKEIGSPGWEEEARRLGLNKTGGLDWRGSESFIKNESPLENLYFGTVYRAPVGQDNLIDVGNRQAIGQLWGNPGTFSSGNRSGGFTGFGESPYFNVGDGFSVVKSPLAPGEIGFSRTGPSLHTSWSWRDDDNFIGDVIGAISPILPVLNFIPGVNALTIPISAGLSLGSGLASGNMGQIFSGALGMMGASGINPMKELAGGLQQAFPSLSTNLAQSISSGLLSGAGSALSGGDFLQGALAGGLSQYAGSLAGAQNFGGENSFLDKFTPSVVSALTKDVVLTGGANAGDILMRAGINMAGEAAKPIVKDVVKSGFDTAEGLLDSSRGRSDMGDFAALPPDQVGAALPGLDDFVGPEAPYVDQDLDFSSGKPEDVGPPSFDTGIEFGEGTEGVGPPADVGPPTVTDPLTGEQINISDAEVPDFTSNDHGQQFQELTDQEVDDALRIAAEEGVEAYPVPTDDELTAMIGSPEAQTDWVSKATNALTSWAKQALGKVINPNKATEIITRKLNNSLTAVTSNRGQGQGGGQGQGNAGGQGQDNLGGRGQGNAGGLSTEERAARSRKNRRDRAAMGALTAMMMSRGRGRGLQDVQPQWQRQEESKTDLSSPDIQDLLRRTRGEEDIFGGFDLDAARARIFGS